MYASKVDTWKVPTLVLRDLTNHSCTARTLRTDAWRSNAFDPRFPCSAAGSWIQKVGVVGVLKKPITLAANVLSRRLLVHHDHVHHS